MARNCFFLFAMKTEGLGEGYKGERKISNGASVSKMVYVHQKSIFENDVYKNVYEMCTKIAYLKMRKHISQNGDDIN